jgi:hypothetical protein
MATIVTRSGKGSPLTHNEVDANFTNLNTAKYEAGDSPSFAGLTVDTNTLYVDSTNNRVGVNTSSPSEKLTIDSGSVRLTDGYALGWGDNSARMAGSGSSKILQFFTNNTERLRIDSAGRVGINETSPNLSLHVATQSTSDAAVIGATETEYTENFRSSLFEYWPIDSTGTQLGVSRANLGAIRFLNTTNAVIGTNGGSPLIFSTSNTERLRITSGGNVGIALTNPSTPLDVNGIVRAGNAYSLSYAGVAGSTSAFGAGTISTDANWGMYFRATTGAAIADFAWVNGAGTERLRITSGGNVGIGVTSPASGTLGTAALDVEGPVLARNAISAHQTNAGVFQYRVNETTIRSYGATSGSGQIVFSAGGGGSADTERMRIDSSGNVGIGTSSPTQKLQVNGGILLSTTNKINFFNTDYFVRASTGLEIQAFDFTRFLTGGANERMRITSSGNVGIGTTNPQRTLQVNNNGADFAAAARFVDNGAAASWARIDLSHQLGGGDFAIYQNNAGQVGLYNTSTTATANITFTAGPSGNAGELIFYPDPTSEAMRISSSGNVLVGTTSALASNTHSFINSGPSVLTLRHSGSTAGRFWYTGPDSGASFIIYNNNSVGQFMGYGSTSWSSSSDERFKTGLTPFADAAEKVCTLRTGTGRYLSDDEGVSRSFLIAQDVQKVLPEAVSQMNDEDGTLALSYTDLIPLLTAAIQEQQAVIKSLEARVAQLEA